MKILVVSDTHGNCEYLEKVLETHNDIQLLIHLGDVCGDGDYIEVIAPCEAVIVSGNNDYFGNYSREKIIEREGNKFFLTHGHYYGVHHSVEQLVNRGSELGANVVMYGHTHIPQINIYNDIYCINPGSLSLPRQVGKEKSYIIITIDSKKKMNFELCYIN